MSKFSRINESECDDANREHLKLLLEMGLTEEIAKKALSIAGERCLERAIAVALGLNNEREEVEFENYKMVFVVNSSLNMSIGKTASQIGHAAIDLYRQLHFPNDIYGPAIAVWHMNGGKKVVLKVENDEELRDLSCLAKDLDIPHLIICDAGLTDVAPNSNTVLALFGEEQRLNVITGHLCLL